jgi:hypothetical protein
MKYILLIAIALQVGNGQNPVGGPSLDGAATVEPSAIVLPNLTLRGTTLETFTKVVTQGGVSGGIARVLDCSKGLEKPLQVSEGTSLKQALNTVAGNDTAADWQVTDGVINMLPLGAAVPPLLQVRIHSFQWDKTASVSETISRLVESAEVKEKAQKLGLKTAGFEGKAAAICIRNCPTSKPKAVFVVEPEASLLTLLNRVVKAHDRSVWAYSESHCGKENTFAVETIAE